MYILRTWISRLVPCIQSWELSHSL